MLAESYQIPFVLGVILLMIVVLVTDKVKTSWVFLCAIALLIVGGSIGVEDFLEGIANPSILTIFTLIIITAGINDHINLAAFFERLFGKAGNERSFILRMGVSVSAVSSIMNNTPVVAMMMPYVYQWGRKHKINPSRLLIPLSFSAILGGVITLIGTSTNLVLNGLLEENNRPLLGFADFLLPGLLVTAGCLIFMFLFGPWLLRDNKEILRSLEEKAREYLVESRVLNGSELIGKTVEKAGLRHLESVFLTEIVRDNKRISPVRPTEVLEQGDVLLFAGEMANTLQVINKVKGLELQDRSKFEIKNDAEVIEAIVTQNSTLDHRTVKETSFREKYDAAIIGIHRLGEKISGKIGSMELRTGDLLLITAGAEFRDRSSRTNDLLIVNTITRAAQLPNWRLWTFLGVTIASVTLIIAGLIGLLSGLLLILFAQLMLKMTDMENIKKNVSLDLLLILIAALALGKALIGSGAAEYINELFFANAQSWSPLITLCVVFLATFVLTSLITNVAAITIIFPVIYSLAASSALPEEALYLTAAYAASCCFATPFAYQTNLMVMEAGNYSFNDFIRIGIPVSLVYALIFLTFATFKYSLL